MTSSSNFDCGKVSLVKVSISCNVRKLKNGRDGFSLSEGHCGLYTALASDLGVALLFLRKLASLGQRFCRDNLHYLYTNFSHFRVMGYLRNVSYKYSVLYFVFQS